MVVILARRTTSTDYGPSHRADGKPLTLITRYLVLESYRTTLLYTADIHGDEEVDNLRTDQLWIMVTV